MGRPATTDSDKPDIQTRILDAATRRFAAAGYDGTSVKTIAEDVGIRKPSLLYHFSTKAELHRQVMARLFEHWNEVLPRLLMAATSGKRRFESLMEEVIGFFTEDPDRARLLLRESIDRPDELRSEFADYIRPWLHIISDYIRRGVDDGIIHRDVDPEAYVVTVIQLVVSRVATTDVFGAEVPENDESARQRRTEETIRLARAALFMTRPRAESSS